jgi:hypothetical protein
MRCGLLSVALVAEHVRLRAGEVLVSHDSEILSLKGDSYRPRDKDLGARASAESAEIA